MDPFGASARDHLQQNGSGYTAVSGSKQYETPRHSPHLALDKCTNTSATVSYNLDSHDLGIHGEVIG